MNFKTYRIADLLDEIAMGPFGSDIKVECFVSSGIPVLNGSNLGGFKLQEDTFRFVTEQKADQLKNANARKGDIVITHRGTLGQISYIPDDAKYERYVISQSQFRIRCNHLVMPEFLVFYFHTHEGQSKLLANTSQVGVPALSRPTSTFREIELDIPDIPEQKRICETIKSICDKIELNNRIIANLEAQAQAIFKSWFVDFEPFQDGEFEVSELGLIPKVWRVERLGDALDIQNGIFKPNSDSIIVEHYSIPAYDDLRFPVFEEASCIKSNKFYLDTDCFMISKLNPETKRIWRPLCLTSRAVCSTEFIVYKAKHSEQKFFYYSLVDGVDFFNFLISHVTGSTGSRQRATPKDTLEFRYALPPNELIDEFVSIVTPIYKEIDALSIENVKLKSTRDTLLPKLMSGEISIDD